MKRKGLSCCLVVIFTVLVFAGLFLDIPGGKSGIFFFKSADAASFPALISYVEGKVQLKRKGSDWAAANPNEPLTRGDRIRTRKDGKAEIKISDAGIIRLSPRTEIEIPEEGNTDEKISIVKMLVGKTWANITQLGKNEVFEVQSPTLVAAVEGTRFVLMFDPKTRTGQLFVLDGTVRAMNQLGQYYVNQAQKTQAAHREAPHPPSTFNVEDFHQEIHEDFKFEGETNIGDLTTGASIINIMKPAEGETYGTPTIELEGTITDPNIKNVRVSVNGRDTGSPVRVQNGIFRTTITVSGTGVHSIEVWAQGKGNTRISKKVSFKYQPVTGTGSLYEQEPVVTILPLESTNARGNYILRAIVNASPPVEKVKIYIDERLYAEANVVNNQVERPISLSGRISQIRVVPVYRNQDWPRSQAIYKDTTLPVASITMPPNGIRYTKETTGTGSSVITFSGIVTDDTLMKVEWQLNNREKQTLTINGVNSGDFSVNVALPDGESTLYLYVQDYFGNQIMKSVKVAFIPAETAKTSTGGTVRGRLTDRYSGAIIVGARVQLMPVSGTTYTATTTSDSNGMYTFTGVPYGRYMIVVDAGPGYQQGVSAIFEVSGANTSVQVQVPKL